MTFPLPRLRHIKPGEHFILRGETKARVLLDIGKHHGYFKDGYASLCHPLDIRTMCWTSKGWRPESRRIEHAV